VDASEVAIRAHNLVRRYGERLAVDHVSFDVFRGEVFGFLGPNGAGKTTTQRMLTGVLLPSEGDILVLGTDMVRAPLAAKAQIGVVPEAANPYQELTGWQNMMLSAELYSVPRAASLERSEELLRRFELWERRNDRVRAYSKGMRQRLILAMSLLHQPRVLFLDEPTSGLDVASRRLIHAVVRESARAGAAIFYTTHNIEEANVLCDRVAIICAGRLAAVDRPQALKAAFVASQAVEVAFRDTIAPEELCSLPAVNRVEKQGDSLCLYTSSLLDLIQSVAEFARIRNLEILSVNTLGSSLEEVFVRLTEPQHGGAPA